MTPWHVRFRFMLSQASNAEITINLSGKLNVNRKRTPNRSNGQVHKLCLWLERFWIHSQSKCNHHLNHLEGHSVRIRSTRKLLGFSFSFSLSLSGMYVCTWTNDAIFYLDVFGVCHMNSIGVRAFSRRSYGDMRHVNVHALLKWNLYLLCVFDFQVLHFQILVVIESECL